jgi:hypothetical protein
MISRIFEILFRESISFGAVKISSEIFRISLKENNSESKLFILNFLHICVKSGFSSDFIELYLFLEQIEKIKGNYFSEFIGH